MGKGVWRRSKTKGSNMVPLKVDGVDRKTLCKEGGTGWDFKDDVLEIINKSNSREGFQVKAMKVYWLSRVSDKATGSIVVCFDLLATEQLLAKGIVLFGPTAGCPHRFSTTPDRVLQLQSVWPPTVQMHSHPQVWKLCSNTPN